VDRPHLAISLRCTMYDAMWPLRTDAMATSAFFFCRILSSYVCGSLRGSVTSLRLSVHSSLRAKASDCHSHYQFCRPSKRTERVEQSMSFALLTQMTVVDLPKQPVNCWNFIVGRPTSCLYSAVAPFM